MTGYKTVLRIQKLTEELDTLGLMMCNASHYYREFGDVLAVKPKDAVSLPIYSRDAELFIGTLESLETWIQGIQWARKYDQMLFGKNHNKKRERKEQDYLNEQLIRMIETGKDTTEI